MRVLGQMRRIVGKTILVAIVMAAPLLYAAPVHAGGAGNCGGSVLGLAGTETCGAYKNDASDVTNPNDLHGFTVSTGGDLVFRNGVGLSGLEHMRLTATGSLGLGTGTPKVSVDFGSNTDALLLQTGTTGQRPATPSAGMVRYNSTLPAVEAYVSNTWAPVSLSACDNVAAYPSFANQTGLTISTLTSSNIALITGLDSGCNVTVGVSGTGGSPEYRVCSDAACSSVVQTWGSANTSFDMQGKYLQLRATSSASVATSYTITAAIGPLSATWIISTGISGCSPAGTVCADGTIYAGLSGASTPMYTTRCDLGQSWSGAACTGSRLTYAWNNGNNSGQTTTSQTGTTDGKTNTANLVTIDSDSLTSGVQQHKAAQACKDLTDSGYSDWYLPASSEVSTLYTNKTAIGNFDTSGNLYWTSSESSNSSAIYAVFNSSSLSTTYKYLASYVRCVRTDGSSTSGSSTNTSGVPLGTLASNTSPYKPGDTTTGLYSDTAGTVEIATGGTERLRITATGSLGLGATAPKASVDFSAKTDAVVLPTGTTGQRPTAAAGMVRYNSTTPAVEVYVSNAWTALGGGSSTLGTSAGAASPYKTGEVGTGLFSDTASTVQIATGATERLRVTATGSLGLGTTTPKASVDFSAKTDGLILQTASAAANASCTGYTGAMRYNANVNFIEYCNGTNWGAFSGVSTNTAAAFSFTNQTDVNLNATISSNAVALSGFTGVIGAVCGTGCTAIARNGIWGGPTALFSNGDTIAIRQTSSSSPSTATTATVMVGNTTSSTWSVTTSTNSPNAFSFTDVTDQNTLTTITSNTATLTGTFSGLTGTCGTGCTGVSRNGGAFAASATGFGTGDTIAIRQITSASGATATTASVTVGGTTSGTWTATTATDPCAPAAPTPGAVCTDGTIYAGISPDTNVKMYTTPCDYGQSGTQGACTGTRGTQKWSAGYQVSTGYTSQSTGKANSAALNGLSNADSPYSAANYCETLSAYTYTDWYLPAAGELNVMYGNMAAIGGFSTSGNRYWSSSEYSSSNPWYQGFDSGYRGADYNKSNAFLVRCVRR